MILGLLIQLQSCYWLEQVTDSGSCSIIKRNLTSTVHHKLKEILCQHFLRKKFKCNASEMFQEFFSAPHTGPNYEILFHKLIYF